MIGLSSRPIGSLTTSGYQAEFVERGAHRLNIDSSTDLEVMARLVHGLMTSLFEGLPDYWRESRSARIWYPKSPAQTRNGVALYDRISFSTEPLSGLGVGAAIDIRHRLLTQHSLDYYFDPVLSRDEAGRRLREFDELRKRADRRKGTLVYDIGRQVRSSCYFDSAERGLTCRAVGSFQIGNKKYHSLYDYYREERPKAHVEPNDAAVYVSFPGMGSPKPVAAKLLRLSVGLDDSVVPHELRKLLAIPPHIREQLIHRIWQRLPQKRFLDAGVTLAGELWAPDADREVRLPPPSLVFASRTLRTPREESLDEYKTYYRSRRTLLNEGGFLAVEEVASREITLVVPPDSPTWPTELTARLAADLIGQVQHLARRDFSTKIVHAGTCEAVVEKLGKTRGGFAIVVFDATQQAAYALLSNELKAWRKKRLTIQTVRDAWVRLNRSGTGLDRERAERHWNDMMFHSAIDILDQMGATAWRLASAPYESCLAIDVSDNRRHFGFTLAICRADSQYPAFQRVTRIWHKGDHQLETINPDLLADCLAKMMNDLRNTLGDFDPLNSLLVLRDGQECGTEFDGILRGLARWKEFGCLAETATVDIACLLKSSTKDLRMWRRRGADRSNVLEGRAVMLNDRTSMICCTGAATLGARGTAEPVVLRAMGLGSDMVRVASGVYAFAQLNYSSPTRAHRAPLPVTELDAALAERVAQDTRGIK